MLASPQAALSKWVQREVGYWLTKDANASKRLFIILTDGELIWDETFSDFDWTQTTSLPSALCKTFSEEPLYLDLRWARKDAAKTAPASGPTVDTNNTSETGTAAAAEYDIHANRETQFRPAPR